MISPACHGGAPAGGGRDSDATAEAVAARRAGAASGPARLHCTAVGADPRLCRSAPLPIRVAADPRLCRSAPLPIRASAGADPAHRSESTRRRASRLRCPPQGPLT